MAEPVDYEVLEQHYGDKQYWRGDTRTAEPHVVKHLVDLKILKVKPAPKPEPKKEAKNGG